MAKRNNTLLYLLVGVVVLLIAFQVFRSSSRSKGVKVSTEQTERREILEMVAASGKIYPETEVKISSDVSGEVVELLVEEGDSVVANQLLAKVDPDAYQSAVERGVASVNNAKAQVANNLAGIERAKAQVIQGEAEVARIKAQIKNTQAIHQRNIGLHQDGVISDADFDQSLSNLESLQANLRSVEANYQSFIASLESAKQSARAAEYNVKSSEATLKELRTNLRRTTIYAPTNGIVSLLNVEQGERVVGTAQMAGTEMMRVANLSAMEVQVEVGENDVLRVSIGDPVTIEVDAYIGRQFTGRVTQIANSATNTVHMSLDQVTNFIVKISIDPASYQDLISARQRYPFRPGMSASVEINTTREAQALSVPIQAVTTREAEAKARGASARTVSNDDTPDDRVQEVVFVVSSDTVRMVEVQTGIQDDTYIQITAGLEAGAEIVTAPYSAVSKKLEAGMEIEIVAEEDLYQQKGR
ncbi:MAG: efflux RND transporter periplasmic adaptor subunit [Bacteroidota bacterium]